MTWGKKSSKLPKYPMLNSDFKNNMGCHRQSNPMLKRETQNNMG